MGTNWGGDAAELKNDRGMQVRGKGADKSKKTRKSRRKRRNNQNKNPPKKNMTKEETAKGKHNLGSPGFVGGVVPCPPPPKKKLRRSRPHEERHGEKGLVKDMDRRF